MTPNVILEKTFYKGNSDMKVNFNNRYQNILQGIYIKNTTGAYCHQEVRKQSTNLQDITIFFSIRL